MTLESYRNFVAIVESGSILAASNKLLIAQPSLSNQLKNIETYYGAKLLIRTRHRLEPVSYTHLHREMTEPMAEADICSARLTL